MPTIYRTLGQSAPVATTLTSLYVVPAVTQAVCSTLVICNLGLATTYRIAVRPLGAALTTAQYIVFDSTINPNESVFLTLGITLAATDVVSVFSGTATVAFSLFGSEIT